MSKIIGVTVGTTMSPNTIKKKLKPVLSVNGVKPDADGDSILTINGLPPDGSGNFVINTVTDVEVARLFAALT